MKSIRIARERCGLSQRKLGKKALVAYKSIQLIESDHDTRLSTLRKLSEALNYFTLPLYLSSFFMEPPDSIMHTSYQIIKNGDDSWRIYLFNFVDSFRKDKTTNYITSPPDTKLSMKLRALLAATTETLCDELDIEYPWWARGVGVLKDPWFVSEVESLKAIALLESPVHYRKRNIFVLDNFLQRA